MNIYQPIDDLIYCKTKWQQPYMEKKMDGKKVDGADTESPCIWENYVALHCDTTSVHKLWENLFFNFKFTKWIFMATWKAFASNSKIYSDVTSVSLWLLNGIYTYFIPILTEQEHQLLSLLLHRRLWEWIEKQNLAQSLNEHGTCEICEELEFFFFNTVPLSSY